MSSVKLQMTYKKYFTYGLLDFEDVIYKILPDN